MSLAARALVTLDSRELPEALPQEMEEFEDEAPEGRLLYRRHRIYERSRSLRLKRLAAARQNGESISCQACGFDFAEVYGTLGEGYIQVHHTLPLHESGQVRTRLPDLALLCANCHAMAHRARPWPSVSELQGLISSTRPR
jgi:5-methylcytosine-specific restriction protein A